MRFYTNVYLHRNEILLTGYENGKKVLHTIPYKPYLFMNSKTGNTDYKTLKGTPVDRIDFDSVYDARDFVKRYKDVSGVSIYGLTNYVYTFIRDHYPEQEIQYDPSLISVVSIDIEVYSGNGFPSADRASDEVLAITMRKNGKSVVFGCKDYKTKSDDVTYFKCTDEVALLESFINVWRSKSFLPDVVTGWNVEGFDVPYLVNRIRNVLGDQAAKKLSPWNILDERTFTTFTGKEQTVYLPAGLTVLDYLPLYKKFSYTPQESYKLDHVAFMELGERKLSHKYDSLHEFYENDYDGFIDYNIKDVVLVDRLEDKLKLIELVYALAYDGKVNFLDTFTSVRMWDIIIHNYLLDKHIVVPNFDVSSREKLREIRGAYVKDPQVGLHKWVLSFDFTSLYPHLIMMYNISPETFVGQIEIPGDDPVEKVLAGLFDKPEIRNQLDTDNLAISAIGCLFDRDRKGFLPSLMERVYEDRSAYKKRMIEAKKKYEKTATKDLEKEVARLNNLQMAKKIQLNSAYGALGNVYMRWFDPRLAESITQCGQLSIRWTEDRINKFMNATLKTKDVDYVIACDTDSMYITFDSLVNHVYKGKMETSEVIDFLDKVANEKIEPFLAKIHGELAKYVNAYDQKLHMKREVIADKGIWTAKKRYILNVYNNEGVKYAEPKLKMQGIEAIKTSTPSACREIIKKAIKLVMTGTEKDVMDFIEQQRLAFRGMPFEEVAFPRSANGIAKYSDHVKLFKQKTPIHVRGALVYNNMLGKMKLTNKYPAVNEGEKVKYCYLTLPNKAMSDVISSPGEIPKQFGIDNAIDYDTQFDKGFVEPLKAILDVIGWRVEKQATLEGFFG